MKKDNADIRARCILALGRAYEQKNKAITERVEAIMLPDDEELPKALQDIMDSWGNTPIEEPELFALIESGSMHEVSEFAIKNGDLDAFNSIDINVFTRRVIRKVTLKVDNDGVFKSTAKTDKMLLPTMSKIKMIREKARAQHSVSEVEDEVFNAVGLTKDDLSKWEQELVLDLVTAFIKAGDAASIGEHVDRTPFARYLKN